MFNWVLNTPMKFQMVALEININLCRTSQKTYYFMCVLGWAMFCYLQYFSVLVLFIAIVCQI